MSKYRKIQISSDSLELLLDTMCNTFGGIMFIAISLLIISSFVSKNILTDIESEDSNSLKTRIAKMTQEIKTVRNKISLKQHLIKGLINNPKGDIVKKISLLHEKNTDIRSDVSYYKMEIANIDGHIEKLKKGNLKKKNIILDVNLNMEKLQKKVHSLKKEYDLAIASESKREKRKLTFNKLQNTKRKPFWGILSNNRFYQIGVTLIPKEPGVITELVPGGVRYLPIKNRGFSVEKHPDRKLKQLCSSVYKKRLFLYLFVLPDSYTSMITIKKYLQQHKLKCNWAPVVDTYDCVLYPARPEDIFQAQ